MTTELLDTADVKAKLDAICEAAIPSKRLDAVRHATDLALICAQQQNARAEAAEAEVGRLRAHIAAPKEQPK